MDPDSARMIEDCLAGLQDSTLFVISHQVSDSWAERFDKRVKV